MDDSNTTDFTVRAEDLITQQVSYIVRQEQDRNKLIVEFAVEGQNIDTSILKIISDFERKLQVSRITDSEEAMRATAQYDRAIRKLANNESTQLDSMSNNDIRSAASLFYALESIIRSNVVDESKTVATNILLSQISAVVLINSGNENNNIHVSLSRFLDNRVANDDNDIPQLGGNLWGEGIISFDDIYNKVVHFCGVNTNELLITEQNIDIKGVSNMLRQIMDRVWRVVQRSTFDIEMDQNVQYFVYRQTYEYIVNNQVVSYITRAGDKTTTSTELLLQVKIDKILQIAQAAVTGGIGILNNYSDNDVQGLTGGYRADNTISKILFVPTKTNDGLVTTFIKSNKYNINLFVVGAGTLTNEATVFLLSVDIEKAKRIKYNIWSTVTKIESELNKQRRKKKYCCCLQ